jgi:hypothetical protein
MKEYHIVYMWKEAKGSEVFTLSKTLLSLWSIKFMYILFEDSGHSSQKINCFSIRKANVLILFREIIAVYCEVNIKHTNFLLFCGIDAQIINVKECGKYINHCTLKCQEGYVLQFGVASSS